MKKIRLCYGRNDRCLWHGLVTTIDFNTQNLTEGKLCTSCKKAVGFIDADMGDIIGTRKCINISGKEVLKK